MRRFEGSSGSRRWTADIPTLLELERIGDDGFRSICNQRNVYSGLFGGQLVAQALAAADRTCEPDRSVHSLHAYFLRAGRTDMPVEYRVERLRDGGRISNRRVTAAQGDRVLLAMDCSYRVPMSGYEHQRAVDVDPSIVGRLDNDALAGMPASDGLTYAHMFVGPYPVELRISGPQGFLETDVEARRRYWLRAPGAEATDDLAVHRQILTFLSDYMFVGVPLVPHTIPLAGEHMFVASLDHCIWFHRAVRCDDWLFFDTSGPNASGGINLAHGYVYDGSGALVATVAQEAMQIPT